MKFFSTNSPLYQFLCRLWDIIQVNFFWLLGCLPVVTIGASTAAAFKVCLHLAEEREGYIYKEYWEGFKENWKQGTVLEAIVFLCVYVIYLDLQLFEAVAGNPVWILVVTIVSGFLFVFSLLYAFPLIARYENTIPGTLKNSLRISRRYFGRTMAMVAVVLLEVLIWMFNSTTVFIGFLIGPACIMYTIAGMSLGTFREVEQEAREKAGNEGDFPVEDSEVSEEKDGKGEEDDLQKTGN